MAKRWTDLGLLRLRRSKKSRERQLMFQRGAALAASAAVFPFRQYEVVALLGFRK